jgi:sensor c-di-GMP phosphodiesterase-like protein
MKTRIEAALGLVVCLALTAGCAAYSNMKKQDDFSETSKSYEKMIFWSNFDTADSFRDPQERETHPADIDDLKDIKVTSYSVKKVTVSEDQAEVRQIVEIGYYRVDQVTLKTMRDQQVWIYNPNVKRWYLRSGLPLFK